MPMNRGRVEVTMRFRGDKKDNGVGNSTSRPQGKKKPLEGEKETCCERGRDVEGVLNLHLRAGQERRPD